jgi:hypothetical protein
MKSGRQLEAMASDCDHLVGPPTARCELQTSSEWFRQQIMFNLLFVNFPPPLPDPANSIGGKHSVAGRQRREHGQQWQRGPNLLAMLEQIPI